MDRNLLLIIAIGLLLVSANIWGYSVYMLDEVKNAGCAAEMYADSDVVVPTFNQELRTDKPPLHYYFMMTAYALFGSSPFSARLFSALFGLGTVLLTWIMARDIYTTRTANYSSAVLLGSIGFHFQFHLAVPDPYLVFFIALALFAFFRFHTGRKLSWLLCFYVSMAAAVMTKGPIGLILPGAVVISFLWRQKQLSIHGIRQLRPLMGVVVLALLIVPWYWAVHVATNGEWTYGFFIGHNFQRFQEPKEGHGGPFFLTAIFYLLTALPLSIYLPQAIAKILKVRGQPLLSLSLLVIAAFIVFFSFASTKLPSYTSPTFPFTAIAIGYFLGTFDKARLHHWGMVLAEVIFGVLCVSIPIALLYLLSLESLLEGMSWVTQLFAILPVGGLLSAYFFYHKDLLRATYAKAASFAITTLLLFYIVMPAVDQVNPILKVTKELQDSQDLIGYRRVNPAIIYQLGRRIPIYHHPDSLEARITSESIVISREKYLEELTAMGLEVVTKASDLFDGTTTVVARRRGP